MGTWHLESESPFAHSQHTLVAFANVGPVTGGGEGSARISRALMCLPKESELLSCLPSPPACPSSQLHLPAPQQTCRPGRVGGVEEKQKSR